MLNYTTQIDAIKTASEIEYLLIKNGARSILKDISEDGKIRALSFVVMTPYGQMPIRLPVNVNPVLEILTKEKKGNSRVKANYDQAERVAWRCLKDWTEAQMALIQIEMARMEQIFLPYAILDQTGQTVFEKLERRNFLLEASGERKQHE